MNISVMQKFSLIDKVIVITGGGGFLGVKHAQAVAEAGGIPVLLDINKCALDEAVNKIKSEYKSKVIGLECDITSKDIVNDTLDIILEKFSRIDGLVNNAANDPKVGSGTNSNVLTRFENMSVDYWNADIAVGLTGAFHCSQIFGHYMATHGGGVIVNIASDLAIIAPDQRLYQLPDVPADNQPVKPVTYSVVKSGLVGLTRYLSTYWADANVRVNAISPGGVFINQNDDFVKQISSRIPMGRMANQDENKGALVFLLSDASSYVTGFNLVVDGGRSVW